MCRYQERCTRNDCTFMHGNPDFLGNSPKYSTTRHTIISGLPSVSSPVSSANVEALVMLKNKKKNRRVVKRKYKSSKVNSELTLMGVNAAGLSSKLHSLDKVLSDTNPGVFFIEETKMRNVGKIRIENASKYQIFERPRKNGRWGGGLALGVHHDLNPVWVGEGENETESLSVIINVQNFKIRCVAAYGPQETGPSIEEKSKFWAQLDWEVAAAESANTGLILQMDANVWAGPNLIPGDPNPQNSNGKLFEEFMDRNPHLYLVNSLQ